MIAPADSSGFSQKNMWPTPGMIRTCEPAIRSRRISAFPTGTSWSRSPWTISVGAVISGSRS